jgi:6-pyruvoyltetrahydropterin/6-carboxytetrahydropterin synthase
MSPPTITRRMGIDAGHRVLHHESKCSNVHGHRYTIEVTVQADALDTLGRVVDFSVVKALVGEWLEDNLDHGFIHHSDDPLVPTLVADGSKVFAMPRDLGNPTAENLATLIARVSQKLLDSHGLEVAAVRVWETPNCWADWTP